MAMQDFWSFVLGAALMALFIAIYRYSPSTPRIRGKKTVLLRLSQRSNHPCADSRTGAVCDYIQEAAAVHVFRPHANLNGEMVLLLPGGVCTRDDIESWEPHSGWTKEEQVQFRLDRLELEIKCSRSNEHWAKFRINELDDDLGELKASMKAQVEGIVDAKGVVWGRMIHDMKAIIEDFVRKFAAGGYSQGAKEVESDGGTDDTGEYYDEEEILPFISPKIEKRLLDNEIDPETD